MVLSLPNEMSVDFYKVYTAQHCYYRLQIPDDFVARLNRIPNTVVLDTRMGKIWHAEVGSSNAGYFFQKGWQKFVRDNEISLGDILVFQYDGYGLFTVANLGSSGCLKRENNACIHIYMENVMPEDYEGEKEKEKRQQDDEDVIIIDDDHCDNSEGYKEKEEEEEDETTSKRRRGKTFSRNNGKSKKKAAFEARGSDKGANDVWKGVDVRKYIQAENPYFVSNRIGRKKNSLLVPALFIKSFGIELADSITLRDEFGRKWPGKVVYWKDGRTWILGWNAVCQWNHVHEDDALICEFPLRKGRRQNLIQVHIVRGVGSQSQTET